ncbi:small ribosomal subunit Rsm22 family protein [Treponema vincentii]|uniref:small ribosomal subunit Rsm22 family protein n=1 Tax=Treponema vincentii TaxID=69710 RepID=UPI001E46F865|nr:small ribosomal subunit Rsm22 family protein [Treponema vincentii]
MHYLKPAGSVLFIEPGIPLAGEFLSLLRTEFLGTGFSIYAPCPHAGVCCFPNRPLSKLERRKCR